MVSPWNVSRSDRQELDVHPEGRGLSSRCRICDLGGGVPPDCGVPGWPGADPLWLLTLGGYRASCSSFYTQGCRTSRPLLLKGSKSTLNSLTLSYLIPQQVSWTAPAEASPAISHCHGNTFSTSLLTSAQRFPHSFDLGTPLINTPESLSNPHMTKLKPLARNQKPVQTVSYHPTHTSPMPCPLEEKLHCFASLCLLSPPPARCPAHLVSSKPLHCLQGSAPASSLWCFLWLFLLW